ncbi:MAG: hypothetical protein V1840_04710 [Candidatus Omnitrophota bacterium]
MNKLSYPVVLTIILLSGCTTIGSIEGNYAKINYSNGINRTKAVLIAKHDLIQTDLKYYYNIIHPEVVQLSNNDWRVTFYEKGFFHLFPESYVIYIKKNGAIYQRCKCLGLPLFGDPCHCEPAKY